MLTLSKNKRFNIMYNPNVNLNRLHIVDNPNYSSVNRPINEENFYTEIPFRPTPVSTSLKDRIKEIFNSLKSSSRTSSTQFYVNLNPNYASATRQPVEPVAEESSDEEEYAEIDLPPPLPPRNGLQGYNLDTNPIYMSSDEIYATIGAPTLPSRVGIERAIVDDNPNYASVDTPPELPLRGLQFHTRFRDQIRAWNSSYPS